MRCARISGAAGAALALALLAPGAAAARAPEPLALDAGVSAERAAVRVPSRAGYAIAEGALPAPVAARAILARRLKETRPASQAHEDIRYVLRLADRHLGPGEPAGRRATIGRILQVNAWWFSGHGAPSDRIVVGDPDGIISTYWEGRGFAVNPVATAGRWHGLNAELTPERLAEALLPLGVYRHAGSRRFLLWEYYDVPDEPGVIRPGASGMAQGRMAQLLARAYYRTGNRRYATAARGALAAFTVPVDQGGVQSMVRLRAGGPEMPWYVERAYPGESPWRGAALNGFMVTLLNLHATEKRLMSRPRPAGEGPAEERRRRVASGAQGGAALARTLADRGARTLMRTLPAHDTGKWSLYGLLTPGYKWRGFEADLNYHCYHIRLLRQLDGIWPKLRFGRTADRWEGYVRKRKLTCPR
ncbi:MAG: heparosan-N-sulfate-glucuronate 5-epimerase [Miltoncostaeaceae bacterium]|nr:heparosan-N-sulfate-glucuronate 5-epimerase [Miltoncostaeaceae bacterium]